METEREEFRRAARELIIRLWPLQAPDAQPPADVSGIRVAQVKAWVAEVKAWGKLGMQGS